MTKRKILKTIDKLYKEIGLLKLDPKEIHEIKNSLVILEMIIINSGNEY